MKADCNIWIAQSKKALPSPWRPWVPRCVWRISPLDRSVYRSRMARPGVASEAGSLPGWAIALVCTCRDSWNWPRPDRRSTCASRLSTVKALKERGQRKFFDEHRGSSFSKISRNLLLHRGGNHWPRPDRLVCELYMVRLVVACLRIIQSQIFITNYLNNFRAWLIFLFAFLSYVPKAGFSMQ